MFKKLLCGNRESVRFKDEKGNLIPLSRFLRNGPKALVSFVGRKFFGQRPQVPWISYDARRFLCRTLPANADVLEFGSGNSTIWYARHFGRVFSVEDNKRWFEIVSRRIQDSRLTNIQYFFRQGEAYTAFPEAKDTRFDFAMIDGTARRSCAATALQRLKSDGILYLDNSDKHPQGGDTREAERLIRSQTLGREGQLLYFTDFAPTDFFVNEGMMALFGRYKLASKR